MRIKFKTRTPLWTGGVNATPDHLHETGIVGSLRWWYEAVARGLGGYACDVTGGNKCELSGREKSDTERLQKLCPACYLFGCGGWKRRFRLDAASAIQNLRVPIHFRTTINTHRNWLGRIFHGNEVKGGEYNLGIVKVYYWENFTDALSFQFVNCDINYIQGQIEGLISFVSEFGFLSAKPQYGFGQVASDSRGSEWKESFHELNNKINAGLFKKSTVNISHLPNLNQAVFLAYDIPFQDLKEILKDKYHYGADNKKDERRYIPCSFDLRYKGNGSLGFRVWLEKELFGYKPNKEQKKKLDPLLGAVDRKGYPILDEDRQASRVFFGMPVQTEDKKELYSLRVVGFLPSDFSCFNNVTDLHEMLSEYIKTVFPNSKLSGSRLGQDIVANIKQGSGP